LKRIFGKLTYKVRLEELEAGDVLERAGYNLVTFAPAHGVSAVGYALVEEPRPGRFDVEAADVLGVDPPQRGLLQRGESIELEDGRVVTPDAVLGPARPGRRVVLAGDTAPSPIVLEAAREAEVLVHEATFLDEERERARETAHSTALEAAEIARDAEVSLLALTHLSNRYFGPEVAREARTIFPDTVVPKDFDVIDVPFPERGAPRLIKGGVRRGRDDVAEPEREEAVP
jgi:ribonuclease Z